MFGSSLFAETVKDREGAVRQDRAAMANDERWIYNDFNRGFAEARRTGKPLLVVLRCVPCLACAGIDAQVLLQDSELEPLLEQFVCVRVINANDLDLAKFQFDYDLSFTTMFFNGDGTVYGRYGSWSHQKDAGNKATAGYRRALEGALALHREYPRNWAALAGKQGRPMPFASPVEIPSIGARYGRELDWGGKVVQSCVHCHQIGDALRSTLRQENKAIPEELIYPYPAPETIGLYLADDHAARVASVGSGSIAEKAGLQPEDDIVAIAGQPLLSIADVSWALHHAPKEGRLAATVRRAGAERQVQIDLPPNWRQKADIARRVGTWPMRAMVTGGMVLEDLGPAERSRHGLEGTEMALFVKHLGEYGEHAAAKNAGFRKGDIIVELDGRKQRATESEVIGQLLGTHRAGEQISAVVSRGGKRVPLRLPLQ
ncbi:MAG: Trx7/PDZ domain-containing (seleno)protein [Chthoniobacteraceae bacterium]